MVLNPRHYLFYDADLDFLSRSVRVRTRIGHA
jgi:hypothetical protein